jgi:hypothetical protein
MQPSLKQYADYFCMALEVEVCSRAEIINWVDCLIEQSEHLEDWMIDLSTSQNKHILDICHILRDVPGTANLDISFRLLVAKLEKLYPTVSPDQWQLLRNLYQLVYYGVSDDLKGYVYQIFLDLDWLEREVGDWSVIQQDYEDLLAIGIDYRDWID